VALLLWLHFRPHEPERTPLPLERHPYPPISVSRHLNTGPETTFIGSAACAECHRAKHQSYLLTAHSRALSDVDVASQPSDGEFFHAASQRHYRVHRHELQLRHEEVTRTSDGVNVAGMNLPVRFQIGSGHFARSYLIEADGFLHESPITWYVSTNRWAISPGYDVQVHGSFERPVGLICLSCHSGRVEQAADSMRVKLREKAIGCESCHGPGEKHAAHWRGRKDVPAEEDLTIVNPGWLERSRLESVCGACHLSGVESIALRGRQFNDFRPGLPLTDFHISYRFDTGSEQMTVAGHMEQLRKSACYQKSSELTCITCHDMHAKERPKDPITFHRQKCLNCHEQRGCRLPPAEREKKQPRDDCTACHMPRSGTEVPHVAFTHHRIGLHPAPPRPTPQLAPGLEPIGDLAYLPKIDRDHNLALAYLSVAENAAYASYADAYRERARKLLEPLHKEGLRDGYTTQGLAKAWRGRNSVRAAAYAREALDAADLPPNYRDVALSVLIDRLLEEKKLEEAVGRLEELVKLRRQAEDWRLLGRLYLELNQPERALPALEKALAIRPFRANIHTDLSRAYRLQGDTRRAADHEARAAWLTQHRQD
jgi:Flp pilus assembly protein TadD